jgi:hypothetical protein
MEDYSIVSQCIGEKGSEDKVRQDDVLATD